MKKIISVLIFMVAIINTSPLFAKEKISDEAWDQIRSLHIKSLGETGHNGRSKSETKEWIENDMNNWIEKLESRITELENRITELEKEQTNTPSGLEKSPSSNELKSGLEKSPSSNELKNYKIFSWIISTALGIILVIFVGFVLIKKCQAKKIPQGIEEAIASHDN